MKPKTIIISLSAALIMHSSTLYAADRGDTKMAAAAVAGAIIFGGIFLYNTLANKKK